MSQKLFDNYLVALPKSKVTLKLNKPVYTGICILEHVYMRPEMNSNRFEI